MKINWEILVVGALIALAIWQCGENGRYGYLSDIEAVLDTKTGSVYVGEGIKVIKE